MADEDEDSGGSNTKRIIIIVLIVILILLLLAVIAAVLYFTFSSKSSTTDQPLFVTGKELPKMGERGLGGVDLGSGSRGDKGEGDGLGSGAGNGTGSGNGNGTDVDPNANPPPPLAEDAATTDTPPALEMNVMWTKFNYTKAFEECAKSNKNGQLMFPKSADEEEKLMSDFIAKFEAKTGSKEVEACGNEYFVGLRKAVDKEFVSAAGTYIAGPTMSGRELYDVHHDFPSEHCIVLMDKSNYKFNNVNCVSPSFQCIICQQTCTTNKPYCYKLYKDTTITSYFLAVEYCKKANPPGVLAEIPHSSVLDKVKEQITSQKGVCSNPGIGHMFTKKYESLTEVELPYQTERIYYRPGGGKHISMNCVTINTANNFMWEVEDCSMEHCFVCLN